MEARAGPEYTVWGYIASSHGHGVVMANAVTRA